MIPSVIQPFARLFADPLARLQAALAIVSSVLLCGAAAPVAPHDDAPRSPLDSTAARPMYGGAPSFFSRDFADPFVLRVGDAYFAFATGAGSTHVQAASSADLATWTFLGDALPRLPEWASSDAGLTWAPSVLRRGDRFVLYYTARSRASGFQCISRATAATAEGPYVDDSAQALVCPVAGEAREHGLCGAIDPSPFVDADGSAVLLWKSDENSAACRTAPRLWSQRLRPDGLALEGPPVPLLAADRAWEQPIVEGPSMVVHGGTYYLFYSANEYETANYAIGYATCATPRGPCTKRTLDGPIRASAGTALGPGGQEFFDDGSGGTRVAYHAWTAPLTTYREGGARTLHIGRLTFDRDVPSIDVRSGPEVAAE
jgi:beta-xylosidase